MIIMKLITAILSLLNLICYSYAFTLLLPHHHHHYQQQQQQQQQKNKKTGVSRTNHHVVLNMFFADEAPPSSSPPASSSSTISASNPKDNGHPTSLLFSISDGTEESLQIASSFMVDSFWCNSPQGLLIQDDVAGGGKEEISQNALESLAAEQQQDFLDKYGEIMGKRILQTALIEAKDSANNNHLVGLVGLEVCLYQTGYGIISASKSQELLKNAVASLGPKQRRQYKSASAREIATQLLSTSDDDEEMKDVVVVSNLVVSKLSRRKGIAQRLYREAERIVKDEWEYKELFLKVETDNEAAKKLYEQKLGFRVIHTSNTQEGTTGMRVMADTGTFEEVSTEILIMMKTIE